MTLVYFILFIGPLIFVHELGHFLFAKLFDVKVLKFSLGFGRRALGFRRGETEYCVAWVPLGGYVKMLGEDPNDEIRPEDQGRALNQKPLWQRYIVVLAGPTFNLIFPIIIYFAFYAGQTHLDPAVVGRVLSGRPAAEAGLRPGDRIVAINGEEVYYWGSMRDLIADHAGESLRFTIERDAQRFDRFITPQMQVVTNRLNMTRREGQIGISQAYNLALVGISGDDTPAHRGGLQTGDLVTSVNGQPVERWDQLKRVLDRNRGQSLSISYLRPRRMMTPIELQVMRPMVTVVDPEARTVQGKMVYDTGLQSAEFFVREVEPGSPSARIGIRVGDRIDGFDGQAVTHWGLIELALATRLKERKLDEVPHRISWVRPDGTQGHGKFKLARTTWIDEYHMEQERYVFGAHNYYIGKTADPIPIRGRFTYAISAAVEQTWDTVAMMAVVVVQIFRGSISKDTIGGPLMLAYTARAAAEKGWDQFLFMLALISINPGILNLLPIPILDGGHILFFTIEAARRKPLSLRARETASYVGLVLILSLLILAFRNDIVRYWFK